MCGCTFINPPGSPSVIDQTSGRAALSEVLNADLRRRSLSMVLKRSLFRQLCLTAWLFSLDTLDPSLPGFDL